MATRFAEDDDHAADDRERRKVFLNIGITSFCLTFFFFLLIIFFFGEVWWDQLLVGIFNTLVTAALSQ